MGSGNLLSYPITLSPDSHHYGTPPVYVLGRDDSPAKHTPKRQGLATKNHMVQEY